MKKDVLVEITGVHIALSDPGPDDHEAVETKIPGRYYWKNGRHYILYDEMMEGDNVIVRNTVMITGADCVEIRKTGALDTHMVFEPGKKRLSDYRTAYGRMQMGICTESLELDETEDRINVRMKYRLEIEGEPLSDCEMRISITEEN